MSSPPAQSQRPPIDDFLATVLVSSNVWYKKFPAKQKLPKVLTYVVARFRTWLSAQGRKEGGHGGHNSPGTELLLERQMTTGSAEKSKQCHNSQLLSSIQWICFRKTSGSNIGASNLLLVPGAI